MADLIKAISDVANMWYEPYDDTPLSGIIPRDVVKNVASSIAADAMGLGAPRRFTLHTLTGAADKYYSELEDNGTTKLEAKGIVPKPMSDKDIRHYFPDAKIKLYGDLRHYSSIDELLPLRKDYCFLLYQSSPNYGHWCLLSKYDDTYELFDSYGSKHIDQPLSWTPLAMRKKLNEQEPWLTYLLQPVANVVWNKEDYQSRGQAATCGRHCCLRLMTILYDDLSLKQYSQMMKKIKRKTGYTYDEIVSDLINQY